jgi:hypothetical protein
VDDEKCCASDLTLKDISLIYNEEKHHDASVCGSNYQHCIFDFLFANDYNHCYTGFIIQW